MSFFSKLKNLFSHTSVSSSDGHGHFNEFDEGHRTHHHGRRHHVDMHEREMVEHGNGVFAWIEKDGMFFEGDIPGVSGIMHSKMDDSFEECLNNLKENLKGSISTKFSSFRQEVSYDEIVKEHPNARIVFLPVYKD